MATAPVFVGTPKIWMQQISTANTARDGTGTLGTLVTGNGTQGSRVDKIRIMGVGAVTAGMVRLYLYDGTNTRLLDERPVSVTTPSGSAAGWLDETTFADGLLLPSSSWVLKASTNNAEIFNLFAFGGDL